jgi:hypothetical protein
MRVKEWKVTVKLINPSTGDYTYLSTNIYGDNEAMAIVEGALKLEQRLDITMENEDWGYTTTAELVT